MIAPDTIIVAAPDQLGVRCGAVLIWVTAGSLEGVPLERVRDALEAMATEQPQGVALLLVSIGDNELPRLSTRRRIARGLSSLGDRVQAVAAVFEGGTPWLSRARTTIEEFFTHVDVNMLGGLPMRLFGDRVEGVLWLGEVVVGPDQRPIETAGLATIVDDVCSEVLAQIQAPARDPHTEDTIKEYKTGP
jgi:hypothetical protein